MSFTPKTWQKEPITRPDLDRIEQGVADAHTTADDASARVRSVQRQYAVNPTVAAFARASDAYLSAGTQVASGAPRYDSVGGASGVWVEESTSTLITNAFLGGTYSAGLAPSWTKYGAPTVSENTDQAYITYGNKSQKVVASAGAQGIVQSFTVTNTTPYTMTIRVYVVSGSVQVKGTFGTSMQTVYPSGTGWQNLGVTRTSDGTSGQVLIASSGGAAEFYVDAVLWEPKAYATSFTDVTRAAESLTPPTTGMTAAGPWTISFWTECGNPSNGNYRVVMATGNSMTVNYFDLSYGTGTSKPRASFYNGSSNQTITAASDLANPLDWHMWTLAYEGPGKTLKLLVDGVQLGTIATATLAAPLPSELSLGRYPLGSYPWNGLFGALQIRDVFQSNDAVAADYALGVNGLVWDDNTLALFDWHNTLWSTPRVGDREIWHEGNVGGDAPDSAVQLVGALLHVVDNRTVHYTYTSGRVSKVEIKSAGVVIWTQDVAYDGSGRVQSVAVTAKGKTRTTTVSYNTDGTVATETHTTT